MTLAEVQAAIPHRTPFLFIDEVCNRDDNHVVCRKSFGPDEWFFAGHYPDFPLVPGVILCEAALQAGAILLADRATAGEHRLPVVTRMNEVRFKQVVRPGDTVEIEVQLRERLADAFYFIGKVSCHGKIAVRLEFTCMLAEQAEVTK